MYIIYFFSLLSGLKCHIIPNIVLHKKVCKNAPQKKVNSPKYILLFIL